VVESGHVLARRARRRPPPRSSRDNGQRFVPRNRHDVVTLASSHARASCEAEHPFLRAADSRRSTSARLSCRFAVLEPRQLTAHIVGFQPCRGSHAALRRPRPSGLNGDESDAQLAARRERRALRSRDQSEYSLCKAAIGCTACARRSDRGPASESPRKRTCPRGRDRPSRPPCPLSALSDRRGEGNRDR
jgi:hypothetical protein